jgi:predicted 2-oxoglutarate/Fe(II)-dependent dioxygenase YbiX
MGELKLSDLILVVKNALTSDQCDSLITEYESRAENAVQESCIHAVTNKMTTSTFKRVELIPNSKNFAVVHNRINEIIEDWITHLDNFNSFHTTALKKSLRFSHMHRLMKYDIGEWIHPHVDWEEMIHASCTIALNDQYEGGDFAFWNGRHKVKLNQGDAMIFPAGPLWVHEVTPITAGIRYSTNTFIQSLPLVERNTIGSIIWDMGQNENDLFYKQSRTWGKYEKNY